jgi:hypothetical protein
LRHRPTGRYSRCSHALVQFVGCAERERMASAHSWLTALRRCSTDSPT